MGIWTNELIKDLKRSLKKKGIYSHTYQTTDVNQNAGHMRVEQKYKDLIEKHGKNVPHVTIAKKVESAHLITRNVDKAALEKHLKDEGFMVSWRGTDNFGLNWYWTIRAKEHAIEQERWTKSRLINELINNSELYWYMKEATDLIDEFNGILKRESLASKSKGRSVDIFKLNAVLQEFIEKVDKSYGEYRLFAIVEKYSIPKQYVLTIKHALFLGRTNWDKIEHIVKSNIKTLTHLREENVQLYAREYQVPKTNADEFIADIPDMYKKYIDTKSIRNDFIAKINLEMPNENSHITLYTEKE